MASLRPVRHVVQVIPRADIMQAALDARLRGEEVTSACWERERDPEDYKIPVVAGRSDLVPVEVVSLGPDCHTGVMPGDIVCVDPACVSHEVENERVANWLIAEHHIKCILPVGSDEPIAVGEHILTVPDKAGQASVRSKTKSPILLVNQDTGILSADGGSHMRICFERVIGVGNWPCQSEAHRVRFEATFGHGAVPKEVIGSLAAFGYCSSDELYLFKERIRATKWARVHCLYVPS